MCKHEALYSCKALFLLLLFLAVTEMPFRAPDAYDCVFVLSESEFHFTGLSLRPPSPYFRIPVWGPDVETLSLLPAKQKKRFLPTFHSLGSISHVKSGLMAFSSSLPFIAAFLELDYMKPTNLPLFPTSLSMLTYYYPNSRVIFL